MDTHIKEYGFKKSLPIEFEIKDLSDVKKTPYLFKGPSKAAFYQIIWLTKGSATFDLDFRKIKIGTGEIMIISANQVYSFDIISDYEGKMILFTDSFFSQTELDSQFLHTSEILNPVYLNKTIPIDQVFIEKIVSLLHEELNSPTDTFQTYIAQSFLRVLLLETERRATNCFSPMFHRAGMTIARRFSDEVEKHFRENKHAEFYIKLMGVGEKYFQKK